MSDRFLHGSLLVTYLAVLIWSVIRPVIFSNWLAEVAPAIVGVLILIVTYRRFQFTNLVYVLFWVSVLLVAVGGHYTYAKVTLFDWLRDALGFQRNHYDRFVHFFQGNTAALLTREVLIRKSPVTHGKWLVLFVLSICLSLSAIYELVEFAAALITGIGAEAFLGLQGDQWDSQWDMLFAFTGATVSLLLFSRYHDRLIYRKLNEQ